MSRKRRDNGGCCDSGSKGIGENDGRGVGNLGDPGSRFGRLGRRGVFPRDIRQLLLLIAEDEGDNDVTLILDTCCEEFCVIEHAYPIAVFDNTVVLREDDCYRYVDICCICEVKLDCNIILEELMEVYSESNEE